MINPIIKYKYKNKGLRKQSSMFLLNGWFNCLKIKFMWSRPTGDGNATAIVTASIRVSHGMENTWDCGDFCTTTRSWAFIIVYFPIWTEGIET